MLALTSKADLDANSSRLLSAIAITQAATQRVSTRGHLSLDGFLASNTLLLSSRAVLHVQLNRLTYHGTNLWNESDFVRFARGHKRATVIGGHNSSGYYLSVNPAAEVDKVEREMLDLVNKAKQKAALSLFGNAKNSDAESQRATKQEMQQIRKEASDPSSKTKLLRSFCTRLHIETNEMSTALLDVCEYQGFHVQQHTYGTPGDIGGEQHKALMTAAVVKVGELEKSLANSQAQSKSAKAVLEAELGSAKATLEEFKLEAQQRWLTRETAQEIGLTVTNKGESVAWTVLWEFIQHDPNYGTVVCTGQGRNREDIIILWLRAACWISPRIEQQSNCIQDTSRVSGGAEHVARIRKGKARKHLLVEC